MESIIFQPLLVVYTRLRPKKFRPKLSEKRARAAATALPNLTGCTMWPV